MRAVFLAVAVLCVARTSEACSSMVVPPTGVDPTWTAFSGVVTGYAESAGPVLKQEHVPALVIRVTEAVLSSSPGQEVQVYPFGTDTACNPLARSLDDLKEQYPSGSAVTVLTTSPPLSARLPLSLAVEADDWGSVARVPDSPPRTTEGLLDFAAFARTYEEHPKDGFSLPLAWRNAHRMDFEDFEYLRALVLLRNSSSRELKASILRNIGWYSRWNGGADWKRDSYGELVRSARLPARVQKSILESFRKSGD
jgi:hypothetical protein